MEVAWCPLTGTYEAVLIRDGRMVGYGSGSSRGEALSRALRDAERRGYHPDAFHTLGWYAVAVAFDFRDEISRILKELVK